MRIEVSFIDPALDGRSDSVRRHLGQSGTTAVSIVDVYLIEGVPGIEPEDLAGVFSDVVIQRISRAEPLPAGYDLAVEIAYRPGVTDPVAITARRALVDLLGIRGRELPAEATVHTARQYRMQTGGSGSPEEVASRFYNPLIQRATVITKQAWEHGARFPESYAEQVPASATEVELVDLVSMSGTELEECSRQRLLALTLEEMAAVRSYYADSHVQTDRAASGLPQAATDVELEMIAQTWSEHCKHKILNAVVHYRAHDSSDSDSGSERIDSLFATCIRGTTEALAERCGFLRSVFHDNSGIIAFDEQSLVCFKVETHNSPSALDPYGGAITGIVGVNRDILGSGKGAKPIFNTNVLCFADPTTPEEDVPGSLLHPEEVMRGVHRGIIDGGNQSGIPTVAGAFLFDESYLGKPLVFCGTGGILPAEIDGEGAWIGHIDPGDLAVMIGGRIGKDGIHGATFSSLALDETSPTSAVQIGDPITQKLMTDFLLEARDLGLYKGITDNGAGGLSSSLGEMAEIAGGITIELDACPLKYAGLAPWEILVSESQERMSLAVAEDRIDELLELARRREVEATVVGRFDDSGYIDIRSKDHSVGRLSLAFLHDGLPKMELEAIWKPPVRPDRGSLPDTLDDPGALLLSLLGEPNIASKEQLVRQYDHEVQAMSVVKPFVGVASDAPSDGAVIRPRTESRRGLTITHGICPRVGDIDTYEMAKCAVDEAYRAHIALGGNPDAAAALDNFCWPDPVASDTNPHGAYRAAQLVRACRGLAEACKAYGLPLVSGKDSMKNNAKVGDREIAVRPTLLVSLFGIIEDVGRAMTTDFLASGDLIYLSGITSGALGGSSLERISRQPLPGCPAVDTDRAIRRYRALSDCIAAGLVASVHDCADGGAAVAIIESAIGGRIGCDIDLGRLPVKEDRLSTIELLFDESPSRFVVSVKPEARGEFEERMRETDTAQIGVVRTDEVCLFTRGSEPAIEVELETCSRAFKREELRWER